VGFSGFSGFRGVWGWYNTVFGVFLLCNRFVVDFAGFRELVDFRGNLLDFGVFGVF